MSNNIPSQFFCHEKIGNINFDKSCDALKSKGGIKLFSISSKYKHYFTTTFTFSFSIPIHTCMLIQFILEARLSITIQEVVISDVN